MRPLVDIDVSHVRTNDALHALLAEKLGFPDYYGANWDAFWDCITDRELSAMPAVLRVSGWDALRRQLPRAAQALRDCLEDLEEERPECQIEWVGPG